MCCYTSFEVSSQRIEAQTMRDCRRVRITEKCVSVWERGCLSLWIRPHAKSSFVSSSCYLCAERHFSFVYAQEDSGHKNSHFSLSHTLMCTNSETKLHTNSTVSMHSHPEANTCAYTHKYPHIHFYSHRHTQLSAGLANSMGNNHALC